MVKTSRPSSSPSTAKKNERVAEKRKATKERVTNGQYKRFKMRGTQYKHIVWKFGLGCSKYQNKTAPFAGLVVCETCVEKGNADKAEICYSKSTGNVVRHMAAIHRSEWQEFEAAHKTVTLKASSQNRVDIREMYKATR
jgi:hypothetical protein